MTGEAELSAGLGKAVHGALLEGLGLGLAESYVGHLIRAQEKLNGVEIIGRPERLRA